MPPPPVETVVTLTADEALVLKQVLGALAMRSGSTRTQMHISLPHTEEVEVPDMNSARDFMFALYAGL